MSYPKLARVVARLARATNSGEIEWAATEHSNAFQASFSEYAVRIINTDPQRGDFLLQIFDEFGDIVEEVSDEDLNSTMANPASTMKEMYETARRKVRGVEVALDTILHQLGDDEMPF